MPRSNSLLQSWTIIRLIARSSIEQWTIVAFSLFSTVVLLFSLFAVYGFSMEKTGPVHGVSLVAVLWSISMYSMYWGVGMRNIFRDIANDVKDGTVELRLIRPIHYLYYVLLVRLGKQMIVIPFQIIVNIVLLSIFVGFPPIALTPIWFGSFLSLFVFGNFLAFLMFSCVGLSSFWIEEPMPIMWIVDKLVMVLGGAFVPIAFFPPVLRLITEWSPFGAMLGFSQAFTPEFLSHVPTLLFSQAVWIVMFGLLAMALWGSARKRLEVNGG